MLVLEFELDSSFMALGIQRKKSVYNYNISPYATSWKCPVEWGNSHGIFLSVFRNHILSFEFKICRFVHVPKWITSANLLSGMSYLCS